MDSDIEVTLNGKSILDYVKSLEQQLNQPVEINVTLELTTLTDKNKEHITLIGDFRKRSCKVVGLEGLAKEYRRDVALLEGEYENYRALEIKDEMLSLIFSHPLHITNEGISIQDRAKWLVDRKFDLSYPDDGLAHNLFEKGREGIDLYGNPKKYKLLPKKEAVDFLRSEGLKFLEHHYYVLRDGIYLVNTAVEKAGEKSLYLSYKKKVADVNFELLK